jgi:hypothetical protein
MNMGNIASPWRYDAAARPTLQSVDLRRPALLHPTGAQAGSQAIVDARMLAAALLAALDSIEALQRYDAKRRPIMNDITRRNRRLGPEAR